MEKKTNEKLVRFSGSVAVPTELGLGDDVEFTVKGGVVKTEDRDNQDGTKNIIYTIKILDIQ